MSNTNATANKFFLLFSIIAVLSGLALLWGGQYFIGTSGTITGLFITYLSWNNVKKDSEA